MMLADMGAEVIRIENSALGRPGAGGDGTRNGFPIVGGESVIYMMFNRNKKSLAVNLKEPKGQEVVHRLAKDAGIFLQNFRPGVVKRLNVDYDTLSQINPALVYCSISAFGQGSPWEHLAGCDGVAEAAAGVLSLVIGPDGDPGSHLPIADMAAGLSGAYGVLAAYVRALRTGKGQMVETSLTDAVISWLVAEAVEYWVLGKVPGPMNAAAACHRLTRGTQAYRCADGNWLEIRLGTGRDWEVMCRVLEATEMAHDPRFATTASRFENGEALTSGIQERVQRRPMAEWLEQFQAEDLVAIPVMTVAEVLEGEHVRKREMWLDQEHPRAGTIKQLGMHIKLSDTPATLRLPSPSLGEHTDEVLRSAGYSSQEIAQLITDGVAFQSVPE
jgi:formyl-CoA transferase